MEQVVIIWLSGSAGLLALLLAARAYRLNRRPEAGEVYWRGTIVLALIGGAAMALASALYAGRSVEVPETAGEVVIGPRSESE